MSLRGCCSYHYIWSIEDGVVRKVLNMDPSGTPRPKFKNLEEIFQSAHAKCTHLSFANRETTERNDCNVEENGHDFLSKENSFEELTLSQFKKKFKRKKKEASESVILITEEDGDASDLNEPLCKFRVKASKSSWPKKVSAIETFSTSEPSKDHVMVNIKLEDPEEEYFESNHDFKRGESESFTNDGEKCELNKASVDSLDDIKFMEVDNEESISNVNQPPSILTACASDCLRSQDLQQTSEHFSFSSDAHNSISKPEIVDEHDEDMVSMDPGSPIIEETTNSASTDIDADSGSLVSNYTASHQVQLSSASDCSQSQDLQQTSEHCNYTSDVHNSNPEIVDEHNEDMVFMEPKSPIFEETTDLASTDIYADSGSLVSKDIATHQVMLSAVPANADCEAKVDNEDQTGALQIRQPERLPITRKFISPNSREKLCQAMISAEPLDDIDHFKCKEKLYFEEQAENAFSLTKSDVEDIELNGPKFIQNKAVISSKHLLKRLRNNKNGSPTKKGVGPKGCLDGPRLCRSLPRLSTGSTSIEGCSESAIAFSQRQMHDIESLASKLMSELNSMKSFVEEKMLYEAYRSPTLKNEADEVKSAIKSATKTEETARKWLSMMARDCNRFCKIMKLNEDNNTCASSDPASENTNQKKPVVREKKKISFADEAGGTLCDIKVYQTEPESPIA